MFGMALNTPLSYYNTDDTRALPKSEVQQVK